VLLLGQAEALVIGQRYAGFVLAGELAEPLGILACGRLHLGDEFVDLRRWQHHSDLTLDRHVLREQSVENLGHLGGGKRGGEGNGDQRSVEFHEWTDGRLAPGLSKLKRRIPRSITCVQPAFVTGSEMAWRNFMLSPHQRRG
jgi:hypothetical protein